MNMHAFAYTAICCSWYLNWLHRKRAVQFVLRLHLQAANMCAKKINKKADEVLAV